MLLICEGACNPQITEIDQAVSVAAARPNLAAAYQTPDANSIRATRGDPRLWAAQRTLRYTEHEHVINATHAACNRCGSVRRFGQEDDAVVETVAS